MSGDSSAYAAAAAAAGDDVATRGAQRSGRLHTLDGMSYVPPEWMRAPEGAASRQELLRQRQAEEEQRCRAVLHERIPTMRVQRGDAQWKHTAPYHQPAATSGQPFDDRPDASLARSMGLQRRTTLDVMRKHMTAQHGGAERAVDLHTAPAVVHATTLAPPFDMHTAFARGVDEEPQVLRHQVLKPYSMDPDAHSGARSHARSELLVRRREEHLASNNVFSFREPFGIHAHHPASFNSLGTADVTPWWKSTRAAQTAWRGEHGGAPVHEFESHAPPPGLAAHLAAAAQRKSEEHVRAASDTLTARLQTVDDLAHRKAQREALAAAPSHCNPYKRAAELGMDVREFGQVAISIPKWTQERTAYEVDQFQALPEDELDERGKRPILGAGEGMPLYSSFSVDKVFHEENLRAQRVAADRALIAYMKQSSKRVVDPLSASWRPSSSTNTGRRSFFFDKPKPSAFAPEDVTYGVPFIIPTSPPATADSSASMHKNEGWYTAGNRDRVVGEPSIADVRSATRSATSSLLRSSQVRRQPPALHAVAHRATSMQAASPNILELKRATTAPYTASSSTKAAATDGNASGHAHSEVYVRSASVESAPKHDADQHGATPHAHALHVHAAHMPEVHGTKERRAYDCAAQDMDVQTAVSRRGSTRSVTSSLPTRLPSLATAHVRTCAFKR